MKLYLAKPFHLGAGCGRPGVSSDVKSNRAMDISPLVRDINVSWPGLSRPSRFRCNGLANVNRDARDKRGHDGPAHAESEATMNRRCRSFLIIMFACAFATQAAAEFPEHPIRIIVP